MNDFDSLPLDQISSTELAKQDLRLGKADLTTDHAFGQWLGAVSRGFLDTRSTPEVIAARRITAGERRNCGVWDASVAEPTIPVATISGWHTELTVPGRRSLPAWAITAVTVSPTHRRRGIARHLLGAELRTAQALGLPVAILTVSESTIYSRWGFAPAAMTADWTISTDRVRWAGPTVPGAVHFVEREWLLEHGLPLVEKVRLETPGQTEFHGVLWERLLAIGDDAAARALRFVRYNDANGVFQGFAVYRVLVEETQNLRSIVEVKFLVTASPDAYSALWRFFVEMDLIGEIRIPLRPIDEPVRWQLDDYRAMSKKAERDHLWIRILDFRAAITGRRYHSAAYLVFEVADDLGFANGRYLVTISAEGTADVSAFDGDIPDDAHAVALGIGELSAIYLGGVSPVTLARAGRITELTPGAADVVERTFRSTTTPWLSIWF